MTLAITASQIVKRWDLAEVAPEEDVVALLAPPLTPHALRASPPHFPSRGREGENRLEEGENRMVVRLLWQRGIRTQEEAHAFLRPDYTAHRHDPFLFRDMTRAVERVLAARARGERIVVHGDYDADGVSGTAVLCETLEALGCVVDAFIPHREHDGYGFTAAGLAHAQRIGARVMITCDCGIASAATIAQANELGIDVIVTDHHAIPVGADGAPQPPPAFAILHPKLDGETYPYRELTGGGVALKLCEALVRRDAETERRLPGGFAKWLLDCAAISTVADFGPLTGENRVIVKYGLTVLAKTRRVGLRALYECAGITPDRITPATIGFQIAPRINAAGRIDHANEALKLLRTTDATEAAQLAAKLQETNIERQRLVVDACARAMDMVGDGGARRAVVVCGDGWPPGIVGLIATKLRDALHRPAIALTLHGGKAVGSGRSINGYHIVRALDACREYLAGYGGHPQACGLTLLSPDTVAAFTAAFEAHAAAKLSDADLAPTLALDAELPLREATLELAHALQMLQPFGIGNPTPRFLARGCTVTDVRVMGVTGAHCRITVRESAMTRQCTLVCFRYADICPTIRSGDTVDIAYELDINEWNGRVTPQMKVVDVRRS